MRIGFDIGGVISKYPQEFKEIIENFSIDMPYADYSNVFYISDMHPKEKIIQALKDNSIPFSEANIYSADYEKYGNMAKAVLIKDLSLDVFVDDFDGYLQWDSWLGPQPLLLKVMPDAFKPYWHDDWKCDGGEFGRRKAPHFTELGSGT
jgi:hypothetical protein